MKVKLLVLSCVQLFEILWIIAHQAFLPMSFSKLDYWSGEPSPSPRDLPDPGIESRSPALQADSLPFEKQGRPSILNINLLMCYHLQIVSPIQVIFSFC